ncbi:alcohol dehydrogenase catalytic domain-containing protein [Pantoea sp. 9140]|uniref:alcohol dehydrogenase catalytic domain-containing protein n=1 Tax=Pantoea sp. 9140 TaxID=1500896 RepID=UPI0007CBED9B|nr:alcohol dehydrogenase catalytic domain-containing protein [Pantoea sp. 9140]
MQQKEVKAVTVHKVHDVRCENYMVEWHDEEVLIKVERGGICGSDIHYYLHGRAGMSVLKAPMILGHELIGTVEYAPAKSGLLAGQRVAVNPTRPCRRCKFCEEGHQNLCRSVRFMGSAQFFPHVNGGFARYVALDPQQCVPCQPDGDPRRLVFAEPLAVCIHAVRQTGKLVGKRVLVTGAGPIGCLVTAAVLASGASEVIHTDISERCRHLALAMGATAAIDARDEQQADLWRAEGGYLDVCFEASGAATAISSAVSFVLPAGKIVQLGMGAASVDYPVGSCW